jgi:Methyltransferase domain
MSLAEAHAAVEAGELERAATLLRDALREGLDPEALNDLAVIEHMRGGRAEAETLLRTALLLDPGNADAAANLDQLLASGTPASWRGSATLGGEDPDMPERAFPGMTHTEVMAEHAARYAFAMRLAGELHVLDLGCGTGYGSEMLSWVAASVRGFDLWRPEPGERPQWPGGAVLTYGHDLCCDALPPADVAVMFEVIEHLADAPAALRTAFGAAPLLVTSFPNPVYHGSHHNPHHVNDWTLDEFEQHLADAAGGTLEVGHASQDIGGRIVPGRDPEANYWLVVARRAG